MTRARPPVLRSLSVPDQVELATAGCVAALRLSTVVQMVPAVHTGVAIATRPAGYLALWIAAVAVSVAVSVASLVRRRPLPAGVVGLDLGVGAALIIASASTIPLDYRLGSWVGWTGGYALAVVMTAGPLRSWVQWLLGLVVTIGAYSVYIAPLVRGRTLSTVVGNLIGYVVLAGTVRLVIVFVRGIAAAADSAQAEVARLARREEERRAHLVFHDATTVMQLLADPSLPDDLTEQLRVQAVTEARRMRGYLSGAAATATSDPGSLREAVRRACDGFADLPLVLRTELLGDLRIESGAAAAVQGALRTLLHNVRTHAGAEHVVVHGDLDEQAAAWSLIVRDDGCGFDPDRTALGVGLGSQVFEELGRHGIETRLRSRPGAGTQVTLAGSVRAPA